MPIYVYRCALDLEDTELLVKQAGGDMVAMDAKYHKACLTALYTRHRADMITKKYDGLQRIHSMRGVSFVDLIAYKGGFAVRRKPCASV